MSAKSSTFAASFSNEGRCFAIINHYTRGQTPCVVWRNLTDKASEIHAKLKMFGSIEKPMALNKFGELLKRCGYTPHKLHSGKRGYIVKITENLTDKQHNDTMEVLQAAGAASTF